MEKTIKVVGCGSMGRRRIKYALHEGYQDIVVWDIREDRMEEVKSQFGVCTVKSIHEFREKHTEALFICVPPAEHAFYLNMAVDNGWNFMVEQPISHEMIGMKELLGNVETNGLVNHVSSNKRFHPAIREIKNMLESRTIGKVCTGIVEIGEWLPDWHPYEPYTDYYPSKKDMGGGLDSICDLEWLNFLFGDIENASCIANKITDLDIDTDDVVQIIVKYHNGPQIVLHTDMIQRSFSHRVKFVGDAGTIVWDLGDDSIRLFRAKTQAWGEVRIRYSGLEFGSMQGKSDWAWVEEMYYNDSKFFLDRVKAENKSTDTLREGISNLSHVLSLLESNSIDLNHD